MKKFFLVLFALFMAGTACIAQEPNDDLVTLNRYHMDDYRQIIRIPDFGGFLTLKCDLHTHTLFSDGQVWPSIRVDEAWWQGLDAIAITDHIEHRPYKDRVLGDLNESFKVASKYGARIGLLVIPGAEITHKKPDGHLNALFIKDANAINLPKTSDQIEEAHRQGAVVMLNHPGWPDNASTIDTMHIRMFKEGKIQLIEVENTEQFYPRVCGWMKEYNLAPAASSDIHSLIEGSYGHGMMRPMTLVLAKERSLDGLREAILDRRTIAFFDQKLAGTEEYLIGLFNACISVRLVVDNASEGRGVYEISNNSDIEFDLKGPDSRMCVLYPGKVYRFIIAYKDLKTQFVVTNAYTGMNENLKVLIPFPDNINE